MDALLDLLLGSRCTVCLRPGRALCLRCRDELPRTARVSWPSPVPPGLATPMAVGAYDGALKLMVNAHKEQQRLALARPLGDLLAVAVLGHVRRCHPHRRLGHVLLVPVPSRRVVVRRRGHDPLLRLTRRAATRLRADGVAARVWSPLTSVRSVRDQAGLSAHERGSNLRHSMSSRRRARGGPPTPGGEPPVVVVVDDVITTGATLREAQRALEEAGVRVDGVAAVAATRRRGQGAP